ncbi:sulfate transporter-like [Mytilus trossulus]|uniref:sulfate transporter-like n=1 Tax=Mytilus trossulus TaxID=6551 RepID=UPI0030044D14
MLMDETDQISLKRRFYSTEKLDETYRRVNPQRRSFLQNFKSQCYCSNKRAWNILTTVLPFLKFTAEYKVSNIVCDIISGLTVTMLHIAQGISFAMLAGLKPQYGLYTSIFPVAIYFIFGTSQHVSFGSNAVLAILTRNVIQREVELQREGYYLNTTTSAYARQFPINASEGYMSFTTEPTMISSGAMTANTSYQPVNYTTTTKVIPPTDDDDYSRLKGEIGVIACLLTGIWLTGFGILRLGWISKYLSTSFIGGFTTALAIHIASLEIPTMLGIQVLPRFGAGRLVYLYVDLFTEIKMTILGDFTIALVTLVTILTYRIITSKYKIHLKFPIPLELLIVAIGIVACYFGKLESNYDITVLGEVPVGFPIPSVPTLQRSSNMISDCLIMALLIFIISVSTVRTAGVKEKQYTDYNQELIAYGLCHVFSSFFSCFPQATSPPRTMTLKHLRAKTTFHAIVTIIIMVLVILWIGRVFESVPMAMIGAIVVASMIDLFAQFSKLPKYWKVNRFDFFTWMITFLVSIFADLDYGSVTGVVFSFLSVVIQHQIAKGRTIGFSDKESVTFDEKRRIHVKEFPSVKVFMFDAPIIFANAEIFKDKLYRHVPKPKIKTEAARLPSSDSVGNRTNESDYCDNLNVNGHVHVKNDKICSVAKLKHVVIDCQKVNYVDISGVDVLTEVIKEYKEVEINVYFVNCSTRVRDVLQAAGFFKTFPKDHIFYDVFDAIFAIDNSFLGTPLKISMVEEITKL